MPETLETIAEKIGALGAVVDRRFDAIDKRFDSVDGRFEAVDKEFVSVSQALAEQREYTEFAFAKLKEELSAEMNGGFSRLDRKIDRVLELLTMRPRRRRGS